MLSRGLFVRQDANGVGTEPIEARRALAGLVAENSAGVPRQGVLTPGGGANVVTGTSATGIPTYSVAPVTLVISRAPGEGVYLLSFTSSSTVTTDAAPGAGSRWDLIYAKQNDLEKGDPDNLPQFGVVKGVAAGSPSKPYASVPDGALVMAEAQIFAGTSFTNESPNSITQVWRHTVARGTPIPVRNNSERSEISTRPGLTVVRLDQGGNIETWGGSSWLPALDVIRPSAPDGNWSQSISLSRTRSLDGTKIHVEAAILLYRQGGPNFSLNTDWFTILTGGIPEGWRPAGGVPAATVAVLEGNSRGRIDVKANANGTLSARTDGGTVPIVVGTSIHVKLGWVVA